LSLNPVYSIGHQIAESLIVHENQKKSKALQKANQLLAKLRFREPEREIKMYPFQLSGGMRQRVLIGMSVVLQPEIVIADEPTKGLDDRLKQVILEELRLIKELDHSSLLLITHDLSAARTLAERIAVMYAGQIIETGGIKEFFEEPLHPYSKALLESLPERGLNPIPGSSPSPIDLPEGCRFHPRCPHRRDVCFQRKPELVRIKERDVRCVLFY
jgi:peptide/nickel transport system ATP-binding protein